uniref:BESS domain-containing protein n=1 Tax=Glossina morsitans morsitans TaxID=37546 RepID=A0A1B0FAV4_GLOMM
MAKTRIKTTPTRMQKDALMASAAVATVAQGTTEIAVKKRLLQLSHKNSNVDAMPSGSTIIVQAPKRTNSMSSATSTISHISDIQSGSESPIPQIAKLKATITTNADEPTMAELTESAIKTLNEGLQSRSNGRGALKNRKVFMITEKCNDTSKHGDANGSNGQKRKMYLIMEENSESSEKLKRTDNIGGCKKLTLVADKSDGQLPQQFEKILPEILNCIQAKGVSNNSGVEVVRSSETLMDSGHITEKLPASSNVIINDDNQFENPNVIVIKSDAKTTYNERLPLTLPPKKNRTKIINTQIIPIQQQSSEELTNISNSIVSAHHSYENNDLTQHHTGQQISYQKSFIESTGATPVIVTASNNNSLLTNGDNGLKVHESNTVIPHKNINLSPDFLFLMKMLPKLESIPEPQKIHVKSCIEQILTQNANLFMDEP